MMSRFLHPGNYLKKLLYLLVFICFSLSYAGSYDDFFNAIVHDDEAVVKTLLQRGFDPNTVDPAGQYGLILAFKSQSIKVAAVLIEWPQTTAEVRNAADESPLMLAALSGTGLDTVALCSNQRSRRCDDSAAGRERLHRRGVAQWDHTLDDGSTLRHTIDGQVAAGSGCRSTA